MLHVAHISQKQLCLVGVFHNTGEDGERTIGIFVETRINIPSLVLWTSEFVDFLLLLVYIFTVTLSY